MSHASSADTLVLQHVDARTIPVWRWQAVTFAVLLCVPMCGLAAARGSAWFVLLLAYAVVAAYLVWKWPAAYYEALEYGVDEQGIRIQRGVFWRSRLALPRIRVQHTDVSQGPLQRRYGVATLKLYTAGSRYTKIELSGLTHADALELRDSLLARGGDSGV